MKPSRIRTASGQLIRTRQPDWLDRAVAEAPPVNLDTAIPEPDAAMPVDEGSEHRDHGHAAQLDQAIDIALVERSEIILWGAGAVASNVALSLAPHALNIHVLDLDRVAPSNIHGARTPYVSHHIGQYKTDALKQMIEFLQPRTTVHPLHHSLDEVPDIEIARLLERVSVSFGLIDDPDALLRLDALAYRRTYSVYAGVHRGARSGHVIVTGLGLPCLKCSLGLDAQRRMRTLHAEAGLGCDIARVAHFAAIVGLEILIANTTRRSITRWDFSKNVMYVANYREALCPDGPGMVYESATRDPKCPVCGSY